MATHKQLAALRKARKKWKRMSCKLRAKKRKGGKGPMRKRRNKCNRKKKS